MNLDQAKSLAETVKTATEQLNAAIQAMMKLGGTVDVSIIEINNIESPHPRPVVTSLVTVSPSQIEA